MLTLEEDVEAQAPRAQGWSARSCQASDVRRGPTRSSPFLGYCRARLADDPHLRAATLLDEVAELGYQGGYSTFTRALRRYQLRPHCEPRQVSRGRDVAITAGGEYLTGYRHYNPAYNRFTQPDPTGQEANVYAYGIGDPVNHSDPKGSKITLTGVLGAAGGVVGGGFGLGIGAYAVAAGVATEGVGIALGIGLAAVYGAVGAGIGTGVGGGSSDDVTTNAALGLTSGLGYFFS